MTDRWLAWVEKAGVLKYKYDQMSALLFAELVRKRPRWIGSYNEKEALVLLYFLFKLEQAQLLLYQRFVQGSAVFRPKPVEGTEKLCEAIERVRVIGQLYVQRTQDSLSHLRTLNFQQLEKMGLLDGGVFFLELTEVKLRALVQRGSQISLAVLPNVRKVHAAVIGDSQRIAALGAHVDAAIQWMNELVLVLPNEIALLSQSKYRWVIPVMTSCFFVAKFFHLGDDELIKAIETTAKSVDTMAVKKT